MLPASVLPTLTDQTTARLHPKLGGFLKRLLTGKITPAEIEAEARTQILSLQNRGVQLSHIDTHKHTHMFPQVLRPVLRAAKSCGIHRVRNPFEPAWSLHATPGAPFTRRAEVTLLRTLQSGFHRTVAQEGFTSTKGAIGVLATGTLDYTAVASLVQALPAGIWELVTHPGYNDADLSRARTRLLASRETERAALSALKDARGVELITFAQLETASAMSL